MVVLVLLAGIGTSCQSRSEPLVELELRMAEFINVEREARGLAHFEFSAALAEVGREHSAKMAAAHRVHHDLEKSVEERIHTALPDTCTFGENVSKHTSIDYSLGDLLMSPGHRGNLLSERFTQIGIGIARGADGFLYITQEFARPCDRPPERAKKK
jgi:uncharacterized protein YkwD